MSLPLKFNNPISVPDIRIKRKGDITRHNGLTVKKLASAVFNTASNDSSGVSNKTIAAHGTGVFIPKNAVITNAWFSVITTFTSATDAATIALHTLNAGDLLAAIAISDATNVLDAGIHYGKPGIPALGADAAHDTAVEVGALVAGTFIKLTAEKEIVVTVAVEALTAGKMVIFVEYVQSE